MREKKLTTGYLEKTASISGMRRGWELVVRFVPQSSKFFYQTSSYAIYFLLLKIKALKYEVLKTKHKV